MVERICPACSADNSPEAERCTQCGSIFPQPLSVRPAGVLARRIPVDMQRLQQAGKVVALGAVALALDAGASWLKQRAGHKATPGTAIQRARPARTNVVERRRVWERYEGGELRQRVVEQTLWRIGDD